MTSAESSGLDLERERLNLERERQSRELNIAERRVEVEEAGQRLAEEEFGLTRKDHKRAQWLNPLVVAILAATIAATGNAVVALANGILQRSLENQKAESARILEMIKTDGDPDKAAENLDFLIEAELVDDPVRRARLEAFLAKREPGSGPSTSAGSAPWQVSDFPGEFNFRVPAQPRIVTEAILTDTDVVSIEDEVRGLRAMRVSYHYLIDESGVIHSLVPEEYIAFHVSGRNTSSIGVGVLHKLGTPYPEVQLEALKGLLAQIAERHGISGANLLTRKDVQPERSQDLPARMAELRAAMSIE